ncbi:hypothetical protein FN846DRAFT_889655 [Sphaerosporella brunnea]|uniref:Uncharacterized protein n=1 Tax=Sphaerosporella brunnea TaxID=1250544 RepID=A0A5J5EZ69_9PEZI|nr:hypothetical protein FN846DRAFT_889655 [Sphaerosporella brunnea]
MHCGEASDYENLTLSAQSTPRMRLLCRPDTLQKSMRAHKDTPLPIRTPHDARSTKRPRPSKATPRPKGTRRAIRRGTNPRKPATPARACIWDQRSSQTPLGGNVADDGAVVLKQPSEFQFEGPVIDAGVDTPGSRRNQGPTHRDVLVVDRIPQHVGDDGVSVIVPIMLSLHMEQIVGKQPVHSTDIAAVVELPPLPRSNSDAVKAGVEELMEAPVDQLNVVEVVVRCRVRPNHGQNHVRQVGKRWLLTESVHPNTK